MKDPFLLRAGTDGALLLMVTPSRIDSVELPEGLAESLAATNFPDLLYRYLVRLQEDSRQAQNVAYAEGLRDGALAIGRRTPK